jgi:hypothetical protein
MYRSCWSSLLKTIKAKEGDRKVHSWVESAPPGEQEKLRILAKAGLAELFTKGSEDSDPFN